MDLGVTPAFHLFFFPFAVKLSRRNQGKVGADDRCGQRFGVAGNQFILEGADIFVNFRTLFLQLTLLFFILLGIDQFRQVISQWLLFFQEIQVFIKKGIIRRLFKPNALGGILRIDISGKMLFFISDQELEELVIRRHYDQINAAF